MKYYVVWKGYQPGIYTEWSEAKLQINGYPGAQYKSFTNLEAAQTAYEQHLIPTKGQYHINQLSALMGEEFFTSISTDAACPSNPGPIEYRGVSIHDGKELFSLGPIPGGSTNIAEYLGIVHGLSWIMNHTQYTTLYSDSTIAIHRVSHNIFNTKIQKTNDSSQLRDLIDRAQQWLKQNPERSTSITLKKWPTKLRGQIPADFGRK